MSMEPPAGFFSTFSLADPDGTTQEGPSKPQKRNRRVFVCLPCHRRKLKCDKREPCNRCVTSGAPSECIYQPLPSSKREATTESEDSSSRPPPTPVVPSIRDRIRTCYRAEDGRFSAHGTTHWAMVASEFEEAVPFIFGTNEHWEPRFRQLRNLKYLFSHSGLNFPFGNISLYLQSKTQVIDGLPPAPIVEYLVTRYLETFELTHRLLHPAQFWEEMKLFYSNPSQVHEVWLGQLCMMLALGCHASRTFILEATARSASSWIDQFLDSAQFCMGKAPYIMEPNMMTLRTLCMFAIARLAEIIKGHEPAKYPCSIGFINGMATSILLHRSSKVFPGLPVFEAEMRNRVWTTVRLLDLQISQRSSLSNLCEDQDAEKPLNKDESSFRFGEHGGLVGEVVGAPLQEYTDGSFQAILADTMPLFAVITNTANSPSRPMPDYDKVLEWDNKLRKRLSASKNLFTLGPQHMPARRQRAALQLNFFEVLVHRSLLAMHHAYGRIPQIERFEPSYAATTESCFALLRIHELWSGVKASAASSHGSRSSTPMSQLSSSVGGGGGAGGAAGGGADEPFVGDTGWINDVCHEDFGVALIYLILAIHRGEFDDAPSGAVPAQGVAWAKLRQGLHLLRDRACQSVAHFKKFAGVSILAACLQSVVNGEPILPKVTLIADQVEQAVLAGKQDELWTGNNDGILHPVTLPTDPELSIMPGLC